MSDDPKEVQEWLRRLKWALDAVPATERTEIHDETRAHIRERLADGATAAETLEGFGRPEDYARAFVEEMEVVRALGSRHTGTMLSVVGRRLHTSLFAASAGLAIFALGFAAVIAVTMIVFKLSDPAHAGLWRGEGIFFVGTIDDPAAASELLGDWIYPLALAVIAAAWFIGRLVLLWTLRTLARSR